MAQPKKLTAPNLNKLSKQLEEKQEILLADGQYKVLVDKVFRKSKIRKMANEIEQCVQMILDDATLNLDITKDTSFLNYMLILRNFTDINIQLDIKKMISDGNTLIDTGLFEELFSKAFTIEKLKNLHEEMKKLRDDEDANISESE